MLYDFKCTDKECGEKFEKSIKLEDVEDTVVLCPKCHEKAERLITNPKHYKHLSWASWKV